MGVRLLALDHPWLDAIGEDPDDVRALLAELGAPYPRQFGDAPVALTGRKSGVIVFVHRFAGGRHHVDRIEAIAGSAGGWPGDVRPGEARADVQARLGDPRQRTAAADRWSLDDGRYFAVDYDADRVIRVVVGLAD